MSFLLGIAVVVALYVLFKDGCKIRVTIGDVSTPPIDGEGQPARE